MKQLIFFIMLVSATTASAAINWADQEIAKSYTSTMNVPLSLDGQSYNIARSSMFKLVEVESLNMLKVYLHKYKISNCPSANLETDLELLNVGGRSVGVNLVRGCILEVYIERPDYTSRSFLR